MNRQSKSLLLTQGFIVLVLLTLLLALGPTVLHGGASPGPSSRPSDGHAPGVLAYCNGSDATNVYFPSIPNSWISSPITIDCAPTGTSVTSLDVSAIIEHNCSNLVRVELRYGGMTLVLWNKQGGCGDTTYFVPSSYANNTFNGMPVNGKWELWALEEEDYEGQSYIDFWTIYVYYALPTPTPTATTASFAMLSGRVYEGTTGLEPPNSKPIQGAKVELFCSNQPYPNQGTLIDTAYTNPEGWYGLNVTERNCQYYNIIETNKPTYNSDGATTAPDGGTVMSTDWIQYTAPLWGRDWTGNKFWDVKSVTNTPTPTRTATPTRGPSPTSTLGPTPTWTCTPSLGPSPTPTFTPTPGGGTDLEITKRLVMPAAGPVAPGDKLQYSIMVWNHGPFNATNVVVTDTLPTRLGVLTTSGCTVVQAGPPHDIVRCELGNLAASPQGHMIWMEVVVDAGACGTLRNSAEVHSDTPDPNPGNNVTQLDVEAGPCGSPNLRVIKTLVDPPGGVADVGDTVRFRVEAQNLGNAPVAGFNLEDTFLDADYDFVWASIPPSVNTSDGTNRLLVWENLSLPAGGDTAVLLDLVTKRPAVAAMNCAHRLSPAPTGNITTTMGPPSCVTVQVSPLEGRHVSVWKKFTQPSNHVAQLGDWVSFKTRWMNVGTESAYSRWLYDHLNPSSVSPDPPVQFGFLGGPFGTGVWAQFEWTFKAEDIASPAINTAEWTTTWQDGTQQTDIDKDYIYITDGQVGKGLFVSKQLMDPVGGAAISDTITFRLSITNVTGFDLPVVGLGDTFPAQCLTYLGASVPPDGTAPGILEWVNIGPLLLGDSVHIDVQFHADDVCPATLNCIRADYQEPDGAPRFAVDCAPVAIRGERPQLWVTKELVSPNPATVGDQVVWEILVENTGAAPLPVVPLHDGYEVAFFDFDSATPAPNSIDLVSGRMDWNNVGPLAPGQIKSIIVRLIAKAPGVAALNCAESYYDVGSSHFAPYDCDTVDIRTEGPDIVVEKIRAWPEPHLPLSVGSHMAFTVTVYNPGPVPLSNLFVGDLFDADCLAYVHDTAGNTQFPGAGRLLWEFPSLAPGDSLAWEVVFLLTNPCPFITNCVEAEGEAPGGHPVYDETCVEFSIEGREPGIRVEKRLVGPQHLPTLGEIIRYEIVVRNTGNTVLTTVPVDDWYDRDCLKFVSALPGPSAVDTATGQIHWNSVGPLVPGDSAIISVFLRGIDICMSATYNCVRAMWEENGQVRLDAMDCVEVSIGPPDNQIFLPLTMKAAGKWG